MLHSAYLQSDTLLCSRTKCVAKAQYALVWANPALHTNGRTKTWLSCAEHLNYLQNFLSIRGFLQQTNEIAQHDAQQ